MVILNILELYMLPSKFILPSYHRLALVFKNNQWDFSFSFIKMPKLRIIQTPLGFYQGQRIEVYCTASGLFSYINMCLAYIETTV